MNAIAQEPAIMLLTVHIRRSVRMRDGRPSVHVDLTVRPYVCPLTGAPKHAVVLLSDESAIWHYDTEAEAVKAYEELAVACEADYARDGGHAWHVTDVAGVPVIAEGAPAFVPPARGARFVAFPPAPEVTDELPPMLEPGTPVQYCGSLPEHHGPATVVEAWRERSGRVRYRLELEDGAFLRDVRSTSIRH